MSRTFLDNSLPNQVAKRIAEDIIGGRFNPGESLKEGDFSSEFGTSRAPIREAFYLLEIDGLVQRIPRKGVFVRGYSAKEMHNLFELRGMVEQLALRRYGETFISEDVGSWLKPLYDILDEMVSYETDGKDREGYARCNKRFHYHLVQLGRSEVLDSFYSRLGTPLDVLVKVSFIEAENIRRSVAEHKEIVRLLSEGKVIEAQELLEKHHQATVLRLERLFKKM